MDKDNINLTAQLVTTIASVSTLGILVKIGIQLGVWKEWVRNTEAKMESLGQMMQQATAAINRILGREEGRKDKTDV
jgi:hypothetical protein